MLMTSYLNKDGDDMGKQTRKELTDHQVRWYYKRIAVCFTDMTPYFYALREMAPDPELRKAAGETWYAISRVISELLDRFGLVWINFEEYSRDIEEKLDKELRHKPLIGKKWGSISYLCYISAAFIPTRMMK